MTDGADPFQAVAALVSRVGWSPNAEDLAEITWALQEIHSRLGVVRDVAPSVDVSANLWALMERVGLPNKSHKKIPTPSPAHVGRMGEASAPEASDTRANAAVVDGLNVAPGAFGPRAPARRGGGVIVPDATTAAAPLGAAPERLAGKDQEFKLLPIEKLVPSKTNPRKNFDDASLEKLADSIRNTGIHLPLIVRPQNGHFEIVAGERRYRAAKKAGLEQLPALIRQLTDEQAMEVQLIENLQRKEVHPLEEAEGFRRLLDSGKYTVESLAKKIGEGKSVGYVYARLKLSKLIEPAKKAFLAKKIETEHAVLIARLDPESQARALEVACGRMDVESREGYHDADFLISSRDLAAWIHRDVYMELEEVPWDLKDAALVPSAGACSTCPKKAGNSPDLFGDVAPTKKETCTDRLCFQSKVDAFVKRRIAEIESKGHKVKLVSREYNDVPKGILRGGEWHQLESGAKPCDKTMKGYVATGDGFDQVLNICVSDSCRVPGHGRMMMPSRSPRGGSRSSGSGDGPSPSALDEQRRERERIDRHFKEYSRMELYEKVLEKTTKIERGDLELLAVISQGLPYLHGRKKPDWMPPDLSGVKEAAKAKDAVLAKFLVASALGDELGEHGDAKLLIAAARRHKLPVDEILERNKERAKNEELHRQQVKRWEGRVAAQASSYDLATCKSCGCVEAKACPGGCSWVKLNEKTNVGLCSACEEASKRR